MSLDDIWDAPLASPPKSAPVDDESSPLKRPRNSLFLSGSDSEDERPPKRATPAPPSDVDALFADIDKDGEDDDLRYKPLAPALDLEKLAQEAEARHASARQTGPSQVLTSGSGPGAVGSMGKDQPGKDEGKRGPDDKEKTTRKVLPKMDEERLVGPDGFPSLIEDIKGFKPKGKGNEHADLSRLLQVYQFWSHRMYPKTSFKDTINRVEKLCHSKRMQVRLSVWRDEFKGVTKEAKLPDDSDVIDLTGPTLVAAEDNGGPETENPQLKDDQAPSRAPSLPPTSSEADNDDFDIDAVIKAEEERLAILRAASADSESISTRNPAMLPGEASTRTDPEASAMDIDEASLWEAIDEPEPLLDSPQSGPPSGPTGGDEDMWDVLDEMEQGEPRKSANTQIPVSGVNIQRSLESADGGDTSRATNDDDWDEMYS